MPRLIAWCCLLTLIGTLLAGCGGSSITQTAETASYRVQLSLDGASFAEHTATIEIRDKSGQPAQVDQVVTAPLMESMGMAAPEQAAQSLGDGRYQVQGAFFAMLGEWEFDVKITKGGQEEIARFKVPVNQA